MSETTLKGIVAGLGTALTALFGGWDVLLEVLLVLAGLDVLTGLLVAAVARDLDSWEMFAGAIRKITMFAIVALAAQLDRLLPLGQALLGAEEPLLRTGVVWYFIGQEGLSIVENASRAGLPVPERLASFLRRLNDNGREG